MAEAAALLPNTQPAQALRKDTGERLALLGQQLLNATLDLLFLAIWAAMAAGQKRVLDYFNAPVWIDALGIVADVSTLAIVSSYVAVDVVKSVRQTWARRLD
ncbi:hypothetical protein KZ829_27475 [Actinoplanes hulinensis]|uniref:Uncharacterized protein n=1 Tax=Actinoplanes hulinensis TaxID=1144547 RepID=A0ABS7B9X1_9ACTN|nr:hypothetical protein [Actinoplanes hulinensis]MBW6437479.1 hypothetical protein [Actinoplanes hulinensis]